MIDSEVEERLRALSAQMSLTRREVLTLLAFVAANGLSLADAAENRYMKDPREFVDHLMNDRPYERHSAVDATLREAREAPFRDPRAFHPDRPEKDLLPSPVTLGDNVFAAVHHAYQRVANNNFQLPQQNNQLHQALLGLATQLANSNDPHNKSWARSISRGPDPVGPHCSLLLNEGLRNVGMDPLMANDKQL